MESMGIGKKQLNAVQRLQPHSGVYYIMCYI